ncbi:MAG TPA: DUF2203 domain-containing protein [Candidatus Baltobacteraceae bacterium]|jgi:hypothetical protein|nr:DUF2203 domain-containing protein [Candidatus Baltobacteraceae bacterium]
MKLFSPEKANALIPKVAPLMEDLWAKRRDLAIRLLETDPVLRGIEPAPHSRMATPRSPFTPGRFSDQKAEIVRMINRIEAYGCIVKDIDLGLVDFPSMRDGRAVYLCWKAGEPRIAFWHGMDETYADRKPLE